jgi:hypothetical protein
MLKHNISDKDHDQFHVSPQDTHLEVVKQYIFKYLKGIKNYGLVFERKGKYVLNLDTLTN